MGDIIKKENRVDFIGMWSMALLIATLTVITIITVAVLLYLADINAPACVMPEYFEKLC